MSGESVDRIEPARLEEPTAAIADLSAAAATLGLTLHPTTAANLADLVRLMNCYYSNLIEGHDTRPREIERPSQGLWTWTRGGGICSLRPPPRAPLSEARPPLRRRRPALP